MDAVKGGESVDSADCDHGIVDHMKLVREFGINGTPALILDDGRLVSGYVPPKKLLSIMNGETAFTSRR